MVNDTKFLSVFVSVTAYFPSLLEQERHSDHRPWSQARMIQEE